MTRQYEAVYIFDSALEEAAINERLARFHAVALPSPGALAQVEKAFVDDVIPADRDLTS